MTLALIIGKQFYCCDCVDTNGDLAQADSRQVTDTADLYDVDGEVVEGRAEYHGAWKHCARCDESLEPVGPVVEA